MLFCTSSLFQGAESAEAKALQNVIMLADLISHILETDGNTSASFFHSGQSISKELLDTQLIVNCDICRH